MKQHTSVSWSVALWLSALVALGCDAGDSSLDDAAGSGGATSSAGSGSGATTATGGSGSGGSPASGGTGAGGSAAAGSSGTGGTGTLPPNTACAMAGAWQSGDKWASQTF